MDSRKICRLLSLLMLIVTATTHAQTAKSTLTGVVSDSNRSPVAGATVLVTATATGVSRTITTDKAGNYLMSNLDPGEYLVRVTADNFPARVIDAVVLSVGGTTILGVTMTAEAQRDWTVTYHEPLIDNVTGDRSRIVPRVEIDSLPNRGRNFVDFVRLTGFAVQGRENVGGGPFKEPDTGVGASAVPRLSFGGQSELNTVLQVDGADNTQAMTGLPRATPSQEAAGEFRILATSFQPQYGGALAGFVNIMTKSGENNLHGSLYYYGTNDLFNARPALNTADASALKQNQYGLTASGPFKKDRAFFFANWEGQRRIQSNPVPQVVQSNLAMINQVRTQYGLSPESNNQTRTSDYDLAMVKADFHISESQSLMARYSYQEAEAMRFPGLFGRGAPTSSAARNTDLDDHTFVISPTSILSAGTVNEARVQWAQRNYTYTPVVSEPNMEISNLIAMGKSTSDPSSYAETRRQITDNLTHAARAHEIKAGFDYNSLDDSTIYPLFFPARIIFPNLAAFSTMTPAVFWFPTLKGAASAPVADTTWKRTVPASWQDATNWKMTHGAIGFYAQDVWTKGKLSLTFGIRQDMETFPEKFHSGMATTFQPRAGFAYGVGSKTVVRGGYGVFSSRLANSVAQLFTSVEWSSKGDLPSAALLYSNALPLPGRFDQNTIAGPNARAAAITFLTTGEYPAPTRNGMANTLDRYMSRPYARNGSIQIEHEFRGMVVSVGYLSVAARDLIGFGANLNAVQTSTLVSGKPFYGARKYAEMGDFIAATNCGVSDYNGLSVQLSRKLNRQFGLQLNYTFSKTISNGDSIANFADNPEWSPGLEFGVSRQHVPHRLVAAWTAQIPNTVRVLHQVQLHVIADVQSGRYNTVFAGSDANGDGNPNSDRPGTLGRNTMQGPGTQSVDVRVSRLFHIGERARLTFAADAFNLVNHMNVTEIGTLWGNPSLSVAPSPLLGFGAPVGVSNSREIQGSLKLTF
jgi:Carboxypeptidase regulatory-like domain